MPGVDFQQLRLEITMEDVLALLRFEPVSHSGSQWYGACPLHPSTSARPRYFSVNVETRRYSCHQCGSRGNQLELWAAASRLALHPAAIDLCHALGREVPWVRKW
jgi:DNA primase